MVLRFVTVAGRLMKEPERGFETSHKFGASQVVPFDSNKFVDPAS